MRLEYDTQRVGIGTASPVNLLHVAGNISATGGDIILDNNKFYKGKWTGGASYNLIGMNNHNWVVVGASGFGLKSGTGNFVVDGGDNVGIGTASVSNRLTVKGTDTSSGTYDFQIQNSSGTTIFKVNNEGSLNVGSGTFSTAYQAMIHGSLKVTNDMFVNQNEKYAWGNGTVWIQGNEADGMQFYASSTNILSVTHASNLGVSGTAKRTIGSATSSSTGNRTITVSSHGMEVGDAVRIPSGNSSADEIFTIASVTDANVFVVDSDLTNAISSATIYKDGDLFKLNNADATTKLLVNKTGLLNVGDQPATGTGGVAQTANIRAKGIDLDELVWSGGSPRFANHVWKNNGSNIDLVGRTFGGSTITYGKMIIGQNLSDLHQCFGLAGTNVGINTETPSSTAKFHVSGNSRFSGVLELENVSDPTEVDGFSHIYAKDVSSSSSLLISLP